MLWLLLTTALAQVALVNGAAIDDEVWRARMAREKGPVTDETRLAVVEALVDHEVLYQHALAQGFEGDPKVVKVMIDVLLHEEVYSQLRNSDISDEELWAYFNEHQEEFVVPEKRQIKTLTVKVGDEKPEENALREIRALREELVTDPAGLWQELASVHSEDAYKRRGGDVGFITREGNPSMEASVVKAAWSTEIQGVSQPVRTSQGWVLVFVADERARVERSFEQMKGSVLRRVKNERLEAMVEDYFLALRLEADVRLNKAWAAEHGELQGARVERSLEGIAQVGDEVLLVVEPEPEQTEVEAVSAWINDQLLTERALAEGLGTDPKVKQVMVNVLLREEVYSQVHNSDFSDEELRAYFEAHAEEFVVPEKVQIRTLTVRFGAERTEAQAYEILGSLRFRLVDDFEAAASEYSEDPYRRRQGDVGFVPRVGKPGLDPAIVEAAFQLEVGQYTEVRLDDAVVAVRVEDRRAEIVRTYEQMKGSVLRKVKNEALKALYDDYVAELRAAAVVEVREAHVLSLDL